MSCGNEPRTHLVGWVGGRQRPDVALRRLVVRGRAEEVVRCVGEQVFEPMGRDAVAQVRHQRCQCGTRRRASHHPSRMLRHSRHSDHAVGRRPRLDPRFVPVPGRTMQQRESAFRVHDPSLGCDLSERTVRDGNRVATGMRRIPDRIGSSVYAVEATGEISRGRQRNSGTVGGRASGESRPRAALAGTAGVADVDEAAVERRRAFRDARVFRCPPVTGRTKVLKSARRLRQMSSYRA